MDLRKQQMLEEMFGEELASNIINGAEEKSRELEGHVAFKESKEHIELKAAINGMEDGELKTALTAVLDKALEASEGEEEEKDKPEVKEDEVQTVSREAVKEAFGSVVKTLTSLKEASDALAARLDSIDTQLAELKKSDDEKIAGQFAARKGTPASQSGDNIIPDLNKILEDKTEEDDNKGADPFAAPYVTDLLNRAGVGGLPGGDD